MDGSLEPCHVVADLPVSAAQALQQADVKRELPKPRLVAVQCEGASADRAGLLELARGLAMTVVALVNHCDAGSDLCPSEPVHTSFTKPLLR